MKSEQRLLAYLLVAIVVAGGCGERPEEQEVPAGLPLVTSSQAQLEDVVPQLVKDIAPGDAGLIFSSLTNVNGTLFFSTSAGGGGFELWKSDGTQAGTVRVKDIWPGASSSMDPNVVSSFLDVNGVLFFVADDGTTGPELWKSDGTEAGTVRVKDIWPGASGSIEPHRALLAQLNGTVFFIANDGTTGKELWKSDGTEAGTVRVKDISPGEGLGVLFPWLAPMNGVLYFVADDGTTGPELWKSDGTTAGTVLVRDIQSGSGGSMEFYGTPPAVIGNTLFFVASGELWKTDGTTAGTVRVKDISPLSSSLPEFLTNVAGTLYFVANDGSTGKELWKSNGTDAGTVRVKDIRAGTTGSDPFGLTALGTRVFFWANDGTGAKLWQSTGTDAGTTRPRDLLAGGTFREQNGQLIFSASDGITGPELWKTDGTTAGTVLVKDIQPGFPGSTSMSRSAMVNGVLFFTADDGLTGLELWRSDGTEAGTRRVLNLNAAPFESFPLNLTDLNGTLLFTATDPAGGRELWRSDGTAAGTVRVRDIWPGTFGAVHVPFRRVNQTLFFLANDGVNGQELWKTDGTEAGTVLVKDTRPGSIGGLTTLSSSAVMDGVLYFAADDGNRLMELWRSDGTAAGTFWLADINSGGVSSSPDSFAEMNGAVYFAALERNVGRELWKTDGTTAGTVLVKDIWPGESSSPRYLTNISGTLFFVASDSFTGAELWKSDGTTAGTVLVKDIRPGTLPSLGILNPLFTNVNGTVFFVASDGTRGFELWKSNGTNAGTVLVKDIAPGTLDASPDLLLNVNGTLFFTAYDDVNGRELWKSDGTTAGTVLVKDIQPGIGSSVPYALSNVNGTLVFVVDLAGSKEIWQSDGTTAGTQRVAPMPASTYTYLSTQFVGSGGGLFFAGADPTNGIELWRLAVDTLPPVLTCPAPILAEAASAAGAQVTYPAATATDNASTALTVNHSHPSGSTFPLGVTQVTASATDEAGNVGTCTFTITVRDTTGPTLTCPADQTAVATSAAGATVTYPAATASDAVSSVTVAYSQASGSTFAQGVTVVTVTARDGANNTSTCRFSVTVTDPPPPTITCPANGVVEATSATGAIGEYPPATASGPEPISVRYSHASGARFPLGSTTITATARDGLDREVSCTFTLTVRDTTAPALTCPANQTAEATSTSGAHVSFPAATASDAVTATPSLAYSHASGSEFPLGATQVTVTASDAAGNTASCAFTITVRDTTAPALTCPANLTVEAVGPQGAAVAYAPAEASDAASRPVELRYSHARGDTFPLGTTRVTVTATDSAGNSATCGFDVTVVDTTPPTLACPANLTAEATSALGANVSWPPVPAEDTVSSATVTLSHEPGTVFGFGSTVVTATGSDAAGNTASCAFTITVHDTTAPTLSCPADLSAEATTPEGSTVTYPSATASDGASAVTVTYSQSSGTHFGVGTTDVFVTAQDAAGNSSSCGFRISVALPPLPEITCPSNLATEATSSQGAAVQYPAATVSGRAPVVLAYSQASGAAFPLGTTAVTASATDGLGRAVSCTFELTVRDSTAPTLTCPADVTVPAVGTQPRSVEYPPAAASDAVSAPTLSYDRSSGSAFSPGVTPVTVTATDLAGNQSRCTFQVSVAVQRAPVEVPDQAGCGCGSTSAAGGLGWGALLLLSWVATRRRLP
jgi:ELWxxDGT repeat protein